MHHDSPWTDIAQARLRNLWDEGLSTAEIGRRLNISKNSVIGKAHRLDLPKRPSPIRYGEGGQRQRVSAPPPPRSPAPPPTTVGPPQTSSVHDPKPEARVSVPTIAPKVLPGTVAASVRMPSYRVTECCWPIGEPGTPNFRFCDGPALPGKPYCAAHARLAYVTTRSGDDREVA
jgi:GcrA cell cycle regulator